jgi:Methyltransferase domain
VKCRNKPAGSLFRLPPSDSVGKDDWQNAGELSVQAMRQDRISDALLPSSGASAPRFGHALLWTPSFVRDDKILWHVPFLFWLLEATRPRQYVELGVGEGVAYMAVCQALHRMRAHAQCFAVGQWRDAEGHLAVPDRLAARNADLYEDFSQILTDGIQESADVIEDGSVDLMLVDLTTDPELAESVQQSWLPKLSPTGILLLNGIGHGDPAIANLVTDLSGRSPTIQMPGGDGLLVVLPRRGPDEQLGGIAALTPDDPAHKLIVQMFTRLGAGAYHEVHARRDSEHLDALDGRLRELADERDSLAAQLAERERQYDARHRKAAVLQSQVFDLQMATEAARSEVERVSAELSRVSDLLQQEQSDRKAERDAAHNLLVQEQAARATELDAAQNLLLQEKAAREMAEERADLAGAELGALRQAVANLTERSSEAERAVERLSTELASERERTDELSALLEAEKGARREADAQRDAAGAEAEALRATSQKHFGIIKGLIIALEENENLVSALTEELRTRDGQTQDGTIEPSPATVAPAPRSGGLLNRIGGRKRR